MDFEGIEQLSLISAVPGRDGLAFAHGAKNRMLEQVIGARIKERESDGVPAGIGRIDRPKLHRRPDATFRFISADPELAVLWRDMRDQYPQTGLAEVEDHGWMADHPSEDRRLVSARPVPLRRALLKIARAVRPAEEKVYAGSSVSE
jgi:hypothetical protein